MRRDNNTNNQRPGLQIEGVAFAEEVLEIKRVTKKTTGGNSMSFTALVAIGDRNGQVGIALGKGLEVPQAIRKGIKQAQRSLVKVPLYKESIPHDVNVKFKAAHIILKPAPQGTGLKVGGVVRTILSLAGVKNASGKILASRNSSTNAHAVIKALHSLQERT